MSKDSKVLQLPKKNKQTNKQTNKTKQTPPPKKTPKTSLYYVDQWLLFRHCSNIPTYEEKCEKTEV